MNCEAYLKLLTSTHWMRLNIPSVLTNQLNESVTKLPCFVIGSECGRHQCHLSSSQSVTLSKERRAHKVAGYSDYSDYVVSRQLIKLLSAGATSNRAQLTSASQSVRSQFLNRTVGVKEQQSKEYTDSKQIFLSLEADSLSFDDKQIEEKRC